MSITRKLKSSLKMLPLCLRLTLIISRMNVSERTGCVAKMKILLLVLLSVSLTLVYGLEDNCDELGGKCVSIHNCEPLKPLIVKDREILIRYHCGFDGMVPRVCCPLEFNECQTPERTIGTCVSVKICSHLLALRNSDRREDIEYVENSRCVGPASYSVCCNLTVDVNPEPKPDDDDTQNRYSTDCKSTTIKLELIPLHAPDDKTQCCGIDSRSGNKIIGGTGTAIDEYPWLAMLEYERPYLCGGTLISSLFVLTAAHCLVGESMPRGVNAVRLGEYNTTNEGKDCVIVEAGGEDCTDGDITINVTKWIVHPYYQHGDTVQANDIGLLRLSKSAPYTDFIRPICLPSLDVTKVALSSDHIFHVAGWGAISNQIQTSVVKRHVDLPLIDQKECKKVYTSGGKSVIWDKQFCAGTPTKDTCKGDSGGPLMYSFKNSPPHQIVGISSFGTVQCGDLLRPSIYTKVIDYMPWIIATTESLS